MKRAVILASVAALSGCAGSLSPPVVPVVQACLPLKTYTLAQQQAAAQALATLPPDNPLVGFITDYGQLRAADRACIASTKGN